MFRTLQDAVEQSISEFNADLNIHFPAEVVNVDAYSAESRIDVIPLIERVYEDGEVLRLPLIENAVVRHSGTSESIMTFPVKVGDLVWCEAASLSIDKWLEGDGSLTTPVDARSNDINDCVVTLGMDTFKSGIKPNANDLMIRHKNTYIYLRADGNIELITPSDLLASCANASVTASQKASVDAGSSLDLTVGATSISMSSGAVDIVSGTLTHNGVNIGATHAHSGVTSGTGTSGPPV